MAEKTTEMHELTVGERQEGLTAAKSFLEAVLKSADRGQNVEVTQSNGDHGLVGTYVDHEFLVNLFRVFTGMTGCTSDEIKQFSNHPKWQEIFPKEGGIPQTTSNALGGFGLEK